MSGVNEVEPIDDDERLFRRIPESTGWFDPGSSPPSLSFYAFRPGKHDSTGLSVYRERYKAIEEVARPRSGKRYYVAVLRAGDLREHGITVEPKPLEGDPGHSEITVLTYENRKQNKSLERQKLLSEVLTLKIEGPFPN